MKVAEEARDISARIGLAEGVSLARHAAAWIGGADAATLLAAASGARTLILCEGDDPARHILPAGRTTWLQADDLSLVSIGDMMKAVMP
jgi:hypothetical protein